jgi:outer membrane immunogenic protein
MITTGHLLAYFNSSERDRCAGRSSDNLSSASDNGQSAGSVPDALDPLKNHSLAKERAMHFRASAGAAVLLLSSLTPAAAQMTPGGVWQGFYAGLNIGGGWDNATATTAPTGCFATVGGCGPNAGGGGASRSFSHSVSASGPIGGFQVGYNWQANPWLVFGLETDFAGSGVNHSTNTVYSLAPPLTGSATVNSSSSQEFLGTVRGRVGFLPMPTLLVFGTGGFAYGEQGGSTSISFSRAGDTYSGSTSNVRTGWAAGGGLEWAFSPQWSAKAEYLYVDLGASGTYNVNATNPIIAGINPGAGFRTKISSNENVLRLAINYHFWVPPPPPPAPVAMPAPPPPPPPKVFIVFFDWDKDVVTPEGMQIVQQAADAYKSGAPVRLQVTGYTDRSGSPAYNQRLSERRANNVARALASLGVPQDQMVVRGRGENDNRVPTAPGVREPQNRRVEITS